MFNEFTDLTEVQADNFMIGSENQGIRVYINSLSKGNVLDVGCGRGIDAKLYDADKYLGIDISGKLIESARKSNHDHKFVIMDANRIDYLSSSYDTVLCKSLIEHLPTEQMAINAIKEMIRVSNDLILIAWHTPPIKTPESKINVVKGHYGLDVYQNRYSYDKIIFIIHDMIENIEIKHFQNFEIWVLTKRK